MADLEKIQFLRSTVAGKTPTTSQLADGELAINMADYAIYTKNGSSIVQLAGKGIPETNTKKLTVDGPSALNDTVTVAEGKTITFTNENLSGEITRHIVGKCASNDGWYIGSGGTSNNGILEIGTIDDGTETIQFVQRGAGNVEARKLVLLDSSGNTTLPGDLRLSTNKTVKISNGSTLTLEMGVGANDVYIKNLRGSGVLQLTNDGNLSFRNYQVYYAMSGKGPGKDGTLLTNVENARQLEQDNFPISSGTEARWTKVALLKDPGSNQSRLQLMVTNGGNYGSTRGSIDFIDCSARNFPSTLTSANIRNHLQVRRIGDPGIDNTNQMRYSLVRTSEGLELWFMQRAFISSVKVALLSIAGGTEYYLPNGYTTTSTAPEGLVESVAIRIYDEINKPNLDNGTDGILSIAKGGTGASTADAARTNLGAVARAGDTMTGNLTINANLKVENPNGTMVDLGSENSDKYSRLTLARKVGSGATVAMLKVTPEGHVQFGYQDAVATPAPSKYILVKSSGLEVEGDLVFNQTYRGTEEAVDITDKTVDLNGLVIKGTDPGTRQMYKCFSSGGGSNIANKPTSDGNFVLEVLSLRKISDTDWTCKQTFTTKNGGVEGTYVRYGQNGSWSAWKEVVAGVQPINLGGTGATSVAAARNNLGVGEWQSVAFGVLNVNGVSNADPAITFKNGAMVREAQGGSLGALILSASASATDSAKYIAFRPFGDSSGTEIRVKANGYNEPSLEWSYGAGVRSSAVGAFVIYAKTGQALHLRPNGDNSGQSTVIDQNGKMTVGGEFEAQNSKITGNLSVSEDNRMIVLGKNSDIGLVKKSGMSGKMAISKSNSFTIMVSTNTNNQINPADTFNDIFKVDADGNQTVYGNAQINRQLTVSSAATVNGVINANGGIIVPTTKYVQIADAPTQNNQATNKKYVDDKVASAISNAGDTYLPLAGGTVTGRLTITGDQLKTTSLWVTGDAAVNGVLTVDGRARFNQEFSVSTSVNVQNNGNSHVFFRKADGTEKGLLWVDDPGNVSIRAGGGSGPVWNFWNSGSCQFPGAISNFNGVNSTTNYPGGGIGAYLNTAGLTSRFSNGAYVSLYFQEYVGNYHQAILNVNGFGRDDNFYFRAGGDFFCTRNGSFDNVEIRSDRRAKSDIKVIENALEKVEKLTGNTYELHNTSGGTTRSAGLIAQEVQEVLPEAVTQDIEADGGLLRLNYNSVIALLVESVKELSAEVKELKSQLK
ncbi:pyocin knob domain-containing S74 family peptidase [Brucella melitensis]|uniref:pyocin knob domain-containing S74 family peptidase n=1 Tax=Brucella melitensis TaxID=29459 RepID=UPI0032C0B604